MNQEQKQVERKSKWLQVSLTPTEMARVDDEVRRQNISRRGITRSSFCAELILMGLERL